MSYYFLNTFSLLFLLVVPSAVSAANTSTTLPLDCTPIPAHTAQLCVATTPSASGAYEDVVIYKKTANGELQLLSSSQGSVTTFGGVGFSNGGRLMWESWADEGHPHFIFYRTEDYLSGEDNVASLALLNDYFFDYFHRFTDTGMVAYALREDALDSCPKTKGRPAFVLNAKTNAKHCLKYLWLNAPKK